MTAREARIAVYGAGAMGTVLGALLTDGGLKNVDLITRNSAHVAALRAQGAILEIAATGETRRIPVRAMLPQEMTGEYDVVFLMTKQRDNAEILTSLLPHLSADGVVCTTQNGLPEEGVAAVVGTERTYGGVTSFGATLVAAGCVRLTSAPSAMRMQIGGYRNAGEKLPLLTEILARIGQNFASVADSLAEARWSKLAINAAFSGLSVLTGMNFGEIARKRRTRRLALKILRECVAVARATGLNRLSADGADLMQWFGGENAFGRLVAYMVLPFAMRKHKRIVSGMLRDVQNGKRCEIDFIDGAVVREGERFGVPTPVCRKLTALAHDIENGLCEIAYNTTDLFSETRNG